ncbi:hypothetical protein AB1K62_09970 [Parasphingorhabdus sp. JC815]|uniref:hypothetical protein n=1 Tax=Parasphingorhabdus sp. JC815 TaxID=3232140 RepID=UPI003457A640
MSFIRNLTTSYIGNKARQQANGTGLMGFGIGVLAARLATRSIPGALFVAGVIIAKAVYDRAKEKSSTEIKRLPAPDKMTEIDDKITPPAKADSATHNIAASR